MRNLKSAARPFKPNAKIPGGSKPGKAHLRWSPRADVCADAIVQRWKGGDWETDRRQMPLNDFVLALDLCDRDILDQRLQEIQTKNTTHVDKSRRGQASLLLNRVYKMHYDGTSAGNRRRAETRATTSREHWRSRWPELEPLFHRVLTGAPA